MERTGWAQLGVVDVIKERQQKIWAEDEVDADDAFGERSQCLFV